MCGRGRGRVPFKVCRRAVVRAVFSKFILPPVWRKDPTLTPAWSLYPRELNGGWRKTPVSPYSSSAAGWTLHTHFAVFPRDERNQEGGVVPSSDTSAQEMPEQTELKPGFRLLYRGSKEEAILYVPRRESSLVLGYFLS